MKATTISVELNAAGPDVDAAILEFLKQQAAKQEDRPCTPSLALIALAVLQQTGRKTSPFIVMKRLSKLGWEEEPEASTEKRKHKQPQTSAAGLNGQDRDFLRACGILQED